MAGIGIYSEKIIRYFKGEYSDKDASYVEDVFCDDSKETELKALLSKHFDELTAESDMDKKNLDHILYKIHYEINTKSSVGKVDRFDNIIKWTLRMAGVILLPVVFFIGIQKYREASLMKEAWVEIKSPAYSRVQFCLPDGTTGWLNSNSSVKYKGNFIFDRKVTLTGEAFFDVFKDKKRPFIVSANEITVKVLGTRFNIASYANEKKVEIVLEEGKVVFNVKGMNKSYTMKPRDLVIYDKKLRNFSTEIVQPRKYLAWREGMLVFRNDPIDVIARKLERYYNIDVDVNIKLTEDLRLHATFIDESLEDVLVLLKRSLPINYKIENRGPNADMTYSKKKVIITRITK